MVQIGTDGEPSVATLTRLSHPFVLLHWTQIVPGGSIYGEGPPFGPDRFWPEDFIHGGTTFPGAVFHFQRNSMPDKVIECVICHEDFQWTEDEQALFERLGFSQPKRCKACRPKTRSVRSGTGDSGRPTTRVICDSCGTSTTVPFCHKRIVRSTASPATNFAQNSVVQQRNQH